MFFLKTVEDTSVYFQDKLIWQCGDEYTELQGKYPVIFLTFKDVKCSSWAETLNKISKLILLEFLRHIELENSPILNSYDKEQFSLFANNKANEVDYQMSLQLLSMLLHKHYKKEAIIIIDEYDTHFKIFLQYIKLALRFYKRRAVLVYSITLPCCPRKLQSRCFRLYQ